MRQWGAARQNHDTTGGGVQASVRMYINVVIKLTEDWKLCRGDTIKFGASKIIFLDSFDGAAILSGLIELAY